MKNVIRRSLSGLAMLLISQVSIAQSNKKAAIPENENSLLWEISGNGNAKSSYLYGTVHMICNDDYFLTDKTKKALNNADNLFLEIDLNDPNEMAYLQKSAMGSEPLSKKLTAQQLADLDAILKEKTGMTVQQVDNFSLFTVMSLITMKSFGCTNLKFYEMELSSIAKAGNKKLGGLETGEAQMQFMGKAYNDDQMIAMLKESKLEDTQKMVQSYKNENLVELYSQITNPKFLNENSKKWLLEERNTNWVEKMPSLMKDKSSFFAVGAGHLLGEKGVINLLKKAGYTVKPILN
nr:TraB/GumN family protein [uncultured Flavobacterium sp.]